MYVPEVTAVRAKVIVYSYFANRPSFLLTKDSYRCWVLLACTEGTFQYRIGEESGTATVGDIILCPPHTTFHRDTVKPISFHYTSFDLESWRNEERIDFPYIGKQHWKNPIILLNTLCNLKDTYKAFSKTYTEHLIEDLLYQIIKERAPYISSKTTSMQQIQHAIQFIQNHLFNDLTAEQVATYVGFSRSQFTRKFKGYTGLSPGQYIMELRLQEVRKQLIETDHTLEHIATQCGYKNMYYLSRIFTHKIGITPSNYRKMHQI